MSEAAERGKQQVAALCWRMSPALEVLLVTSLKTQRWIVPKGWPHDGMSLAQSAAIEAAEEAGVTGEVAALPLGHYRYIKDKQGAALPIRVEVFALKVTAQAESWPEKGTRKLLWLPPDQAAGRVAETGLKNILTNFRASRVNVA
ncbi:MAG TPA: NUDIX hydrolase [Rhizomicrobium sp.]|nr:NUDIX hydrolase [Rhizomicrobium sp.]